jgi:kynureninase
MNNSNYTKKNMPTSNATELAALYQKPDGIYALAHSVGPLCKAARHSLNNNFLETWQHLGGDAWPKWLAQITRFQQALAALLSADFNDFCPQPSVSLAFSLWLSAQSKNRMSKQRRKVLMHEDAFASLGFAVQGLCDTYNIELVLLNTPANDLDAWEQVLSKNEVFACLITHAHSNTGELSDVAAIINIAKQHKVLTCVDIAQSVGIIPIDLRLWQADCVVGSCVKWLSGGPGAAFMYVPVEQANTLTPEHLAWFSHENPFEFDIRHFAPANGAMRFWGGTPSIAPYTMAAAAIEQHNGYSTALFREHNQLLMRLFLKDYPFDIPRHYEKLTQTNKRLEAKTAYSATLCLALPKSNAHSLCEALGKHQLKFDQRNGQIRLSFSAINHADEVQTINEILRS